MVRAAISLNKITGINQVVIGATFVSVATTLPEVFVSIFAVSTGNYGIAVGNAIGAMIANIALVLAISMIFLPNCAKKSEIAPKVLFLLVTTIIVFLFAMNLQISFFESAILIATFALFMLYNPAIKHPERVPSPPARGEWGKIVLGFIVGQCMLCAGAFSLVNNGEKLAHFFNISETVVGFTVIALGTSLPELTTAITSLRCKSGKLAIGNAIGANIINCTLLLGVCGVVGNMVAPNLPISAATVFISMPILLLMTAIAVLPVLIRGRVYRWQGAVLCLAYVAYVAYLMLAQPI